MSEKQKVQRTMSTFQADAEFIASTIPYYPFHGVPRFYDISGMLANPVAYKKCIDIFISRFQDKGIEFIAGLDARGFVIGPPIALALGVPFVMIRKEGKLPNCTKGSEYFKEYKGASATGGDTFCVPNGYIQPGMKGIIVDDLMATGGTMISAVDLLKSIGAVVLECAVMVELKCLGGGDKLKAKHSDVVLWNLLDENMLQVEGKLPEQDDEHK